ncbi:MAG TPA: glutamate synthase subunit beta [Kofleriaceae bacterium]|nr:glutamate synthase subunit beta [Kofleriaceae bacterium]
MGKPTGFIEWHRLLPKKRDPRDRLRDYKEFYQPQPLQQTREQGGRCMDCGVPMCQQGCPLGNQIPDWNELVYRDRWEEAHRRLAATNNFPEFTGRLCPAPCEAACVLAINDQPVTIEQMEKEIIEHAFAHDWVMPQPPRQRTGRHVAIVGSGPAGLAAAAQLNSVGHRVTVYERDDRIGGLLRYGIPDFKMEKWVIDRRLEVMKDEGIQFVTDADVGGALSWGELRQRHDAVLIAIGAGTPRDLQVPGRELDGVHFAMDYLPQQNRLNAGDTLEGPHIDAAGKRVIILGGGDTGSDCLGTALRQGAAEVHQIELMPRPPNERTPQNPWPRWPQVYRVSSSQEEGGERDFAVLTKRLSGSGGKVSALHAVRIEVEPDATGRPSFVEQPGSEFEIKCDLVLLAMGFTGPDASRVVDQLGVALDGRGNIATDATFATTVDGVFSAGDAQRGQSLIVWAISDGREAARAIDSYLREGAKPWLPTRGHDQPF